MTPSNEDHVGPRALLVDDDRNCRRLISAVLQAALGRVRIAHAGSGSAAINWLAASPFEVVVTDLDLPEEDGVQVVRLARRLNPDAVIIVATGRGAAEAEDLAMRAGASIKIGKPFDVEGLIAYLHGGWVQAIGAAPGSQVPATSMVEAHERMGLAGGSPVCVTGALSRRR